MKAFSLALLLALAALDFTLARPALASDEPCQLLPAATGTEVGNGKKRLAKRDERLPLDEAEAILIYDTSPTFNLIVAPDFRVAWMVERRPVTHEQVITPYAGLSAVSRLVTAAQFGQKDFTQAPADAKCSRP